MKRRRCGDAGMRGLTLLQQVLHFMEIWARFTFPDTTRFNPLLYERKPDSSD